MDNLREVPIEKFKKMIDEKSRQKICEEFNISRRTLNRILKEKGLTGYGLNRMSNFEYNEIKELYRKKKFTQMQLSDKYQVSQSLISKIVNGLVCRNNINFSISGEADVKMGCKHGNS